MKNTILVLSILLSSMIQAQVYYQAIGESMKEKSNYDVTVTDLYGNYNQYQVQIENLNPSTKVYTGNTYTEGYGSDGYGDFGDIALQAARVARQQKQANQNDNYSKRIRYLEFELRSALNVIKNQSHYINILNTNSELEQMLADKQIEILQMQIEAGNQLEKTFTFPDRYTRIHITPSMESKKIYPYEGEKFKLIGMKSYGKNELWRKIKYKNQEYFVRKMDLNLIINK